MSVAASDSSGLEQLSVVRDADCSDLEDLALQVDTTAPPTDACTSSQLDKESNGMNSICVAAFSTEDGCLWGSHDAALHSVMDSCLQAKRSMIAIPMQHIEEQTDGHTSVLVAQHILQTAARVLSKA